MKTIKLTKLSSSGVLGEICRPRLIWDGFYFPAHTKQGRIERLEVVKVCMHARVCP